MAWKDKAKEENYRKAYSKKYYQEHKQQSLKYGKEYYKKVKESKLKYAKNYRDLHPEAKRKSTLKLKFGLTLTDYNKMFEKQQGCCAICGKHQSELTRALAVDHNHLSGKIRGLLCSSCNAAIGSLGTDYGVELLQKAIDYIRKYDKV